VRKAMECSHNPKVVGSNPTPATRKHEGLAVTAASPFVVLDVFGTCSESRPPSEARVLFLPLPTRLAVREPWRQMNLILIES